MYSAVFDYAYKAAYSFLSMLPEDMAIELGQRALKNLPAGYFPPITDDWKLEKTIAGVQLANPLVLASYYKDPDIWENAFALGFGAVTTKTTTLQGIDKQPGRVFRRGKGFVNREQYPNYGLKKTKGNIEDFRGRYVGRGKLIVSIGAMDSVDEYITLARELSEAADFIEVNASSPNNNIAYRLSTNPQYVDKISSGLKDVSGKPVIWKLSPDHPEENRSVVIPMLIRNGVEAIEWANTRRVEEKRLPDGFGALSGPELYEPMSWDVVEVSGEFGNDIDIVACGGIDSPEKAMHMLFYANGVAMLSGFVHDIGLPRRINERLLKTVLS